MSGAVPVRSITICTKDYGLFMVGGGDVYHRREGAASGLISLLVVQFARAPI